MGTRKGRGNTGKGSPIAAKVHSGDPRGAVGFGYGNGQTGHGANSKERQVKVRTLPNNAKRMSG